MAYVQKAPIYQDHKKTYHADTCAPVKKAVRDGKIKLSALKRSKYPGIDIKYDELVGINTNGIETRELRSPFLSLVHFHLKCTIISNMPFSPMTLQSQDPGSLIELGIQM